MAGAKLIPEMFQGNARRFKKPGIYSIVITAQSKRRNPCD
jgi:hypothetical protein